VTDYGFPGFEEVAPPVMLTSMQAVVVTEYGDRAEAIEVPAPEAHAGQVLIKVRARSRRARGWLDRSAAVQARFADPGAGVFAGENGFVRDGKTVIVL
jgi:hypothetical protein